eukprot:972196-Amphidinium_carterae.1
MLTNRTLQDIPLPADAQNEVTNVSASQRKYPPFHRSVRLVLPIDLTLKHVNSQVVDLMLLAALSLNLS